MDASSIQELIDDAVAECVKNDYAFCAYGGVIAKRLGAGIEANLATQQARIKKLEAAVKELRGALHAINLCQFNSMSSRSEMVRLAAEALENTEDV